MENKTESRWKIARTKNQSFKDDKEEKERVKLNQKGLKRTET